MGELLDYSYARFTPAEVVAAGRAGVVRYVASGRPEVSATRAEVDGFRAAGLAFVAVWQRGSERALLGRDAGVVDAGDALAYCAGLGATLADPVYFAVDTDVINADELDRVVDYFAGAASVLGWSRVGVYGEHQVLTHLRRATPIGLFWQTTSWSGSLVAPHANMVQYARNQTLLGRLVDYNVTLTEHYGQWGTPMPTIYPGAHWAPLGAQTQDPMSRHDVVCLHTMVGYLTSTDPYFRISNGAGYRGTESHFGVGGKWGPDLGGGLDGAVWQWQDLAFTADANYQGNSRVISIETADNAPDLPGDIAAWTPAQVESIIDLCVWLCRRYAIPPRLIGDTRPGTRGIGYHAQGTAAALPAGAERWSTTVGKPCPAARRIAQLTSIIIPRVAAALRGEPEDDMPTPEEIAQAVWEYRFVDPTDVRVPPHLNAARIYVGAASGRAAQTLAGVATLLGRPAADVDEAALAEALAPMLPGMLTRLPDEEVARLASAVADEQARRLAE